VLAGNPVYLTEGGYCRSTEQKTKKKGGLHDGIMVRHVIGFNRAENADYELRIA
jgi:hypothetical protein